MRKLLILTMIGFVAQLIDGSLGMAYGATSASFLLLFGVAPALASASIHLAEIATTAVAGVSHWWFGNVDRKILVKLVIPGAVSAFLGAAFLSHIPGDRIKPFVSFFLLIMGVYIVWRFLFHVRPETPKEVKLSKAYLIPLGIVGGFFDAVGGGGWGPITTPMLLSKKGMSPRVVIGTVDTSEFVIAVSASLGFLLFLGWEQFNIYWVAALVIGGVIAAPIAAWIVRVIPSYLLGVLVGGFIVILNVGQVLKIFPVPSLGIWTIYSMLIVLWGFAIWWQLQSSRKRKQSLEA
ncbi:sulfite exporter TauE/SafE family protein [Thermoactinomyces mirandus]|uniref:Probable membrane transporter protein n=1 Tax=Thermoactinomyces mirandus TaxID=2756294 RepID=A0A7W1XQU9_9BACL|nr:sulfite exporter TauE/SafE family protein [Thermoactinomyces mirandus]MBA4601502.1 sulfite exporter TauE/SafE family protein [Thermoactinomyces mirandus]